MKPAFLRVLLVLLAITFSQVQLHAGTFNVIDFGARPDGSASSTEAISAAIKAAKQAGGGTVLIPAGNYVTGPIELISNMVLHIEAGAVVRFPAQRLPYTKSRVQGIECLAPVPLIGGANLENVTITGRGTITTDNADWVKLMGSPEPRTATYPGSAFGAQWNRLRDLLQQKTPQSDEEYLKAAPFLRPAFIRTTESKNVLIEGIQILGSSFWTIHLLYCQNANVRDITLKTFPGIFTGAIYVDSCKDVRVSNCDLDAGDDAIVLKAGKDADGLRVNRPCENVAISNCIIHRGSGAIVIGSETSGWIRNVVASNIICQGTQMGIHIKSERGRGGGVENVRIDNVTMEDVSRPVTVTMFYQMQGERLTSAAAPEPVTRTTPIIRDIGISHVTIKSSTGVIDFSWNPIATSSSSGEGSKPLAIDIQGLPEMPLERLRLSDIIATGKGNLVASHAMGMELHNIQVNSEVSPPFLIRESREATLDGLTTRQPPAKGPLIRLEHSAGTVVRNSVGFDGIEALVSVPPGELKGITFQGNSVGSGRESIESSAPSP